MGLLAFRDRLYNEEHKMLSFNGELFTKDAKLFSNSGGEVKGRRGRRSP